MFKHYIETISQNKVLMAAAFPLFTIMLYMFAYMNSTLLADASFSLEAVFLRLLFIILIGYTCITPVMEGLIEKYVKPVSQTYTFWHYVSFWFPVMLLAGLLFLLMIYKVFIPINNAGRGGIGVIVMFIFTVAFLVSYFFAPKYGLRHKIKTRHDFFDRFGRTSLQKAPSVVMMMGVIFVLFAGLAQLMLYVMMNVEIPQMALDILYSMFYGMCLVFMCPVIPTVQTYNRL